MANKIWRMGWVLLLVAMIAGSGFSAPNKWPRGNEGITRQTSEDGAAISLPDGYILINNTWNKRATTGYYKERIFTKEINGEKTFGWEWLWGDSYSVVAYPEVFYGDTPWDSVQMSSPGMPFLAGSKNVTINYHVDLKASGTYNMAFEFWAVTKVPATSKDITHEVMIWNYNRGMTPAGTKIDEVNIDGVNYNVYLRADHGDASGVSSVKWAYIAFAARKPVLDGPLNISNFIDYLIDKEILNKNLYITTMEFGNEIVQGSGRAEISNYSVTIQ